MWMAVSHITDVESIILYLYFQINKFVKGFHPLLWSRNQCVCLTKKNNKINCFEQSRLVSVLALAEAGEGKAAVGFGVSPCHPLQRGHRSCGPPQGVIFAE